MFWKKYILFVMLNFIILLEFNKVYIHAKPILTYGTY
jgi:hypothetical protein